MVDVSVIIPVYNASKHLEECIRSVCTQTLESIEIICVDDSIEETGFKNEQFALIHPGGAVGERLNKK